MPLEVKSHTIPHLKALTRSIEHAEANERKHLHGAVFTFNSNVHFLVKNAKHAFPSMANKEPTF